MNLQENIFFIPPLNLYQFPLFKGGTQYEKHVFWKIHKHPPICCVVDINSKYPYQMENAIKVVGIVFFQISLGPNTLPVSCDYCT